jgi:hypothetical protein
VYSILTYSVGSPVEVEICTLVVHVVNEPVLSETEKRLGGALFLLYLSLYHCWSVCTLAK